MTHGQPFSFCVTMNVSSEGIASWRFLQWVARQRMQAPVSRADLTGLMPCFVRLLLFGNDISLHTWKSLAAFCRYRLCLAKTHIEFKSAVTERTPSIVARYWGFTFRDCNKTTHSRASGLVLLSQLFSVFANWISSLHWKHSMPPRVFGNGGVETAEKSEH